jgi:hypothetical protein
MSPGRREELSEVRRLEPAVQAVEGLVWSEVASCVDEADLGDVLIRTTHRVDPLDGGRSLVTYRMEISSPAADVIGPELGPKISGDFPETLAALVEQAEQAPP